MNKKNIINIIVIGVLVFVLFGAGYFYVSGKGGNELPITISGVASTTQKFQALAMQLSPLSFNTDILSDARFEALHEMSAPFTDVQKGRIDPFAPF